MDKYLRLNILRNVALSVALAGAVGAVIITFQGGRNNPSVLLRLLFVIWVLSPFIAFAITDMVSKRWIFIVRRILYILILVVTVGSLIFYSGVLKPKDVKPAFVFLVVPLVSWILLVILILIAVRLSRKRAAE